MKIYVRKVEPAFIDGIYQFRPWVKLVNDDLRLKELEAYFGELRPGDTWQLEFKRDV